MDSNNNDQQNNTTQPSINLNDIKLGNIGVKAKSILVDGKRIPNSILHEFVKEYLKVTNNDYKTVLEQLLILDALAEKDQLPDDIS